MDKIIGEIIKSLRDNMKDIVNLNVKIMKHTNEDISKVEEWITNSMLELYRLKVKLYESAGERPYFFFSDSDDDSDDYSDDDSEVEGNSKKIYNSIV